MRTVIIIVALLAGFIQPLPASNPKGSKKAIRAEKTIWLLGCSDASAVADVGDGYLFVADDETNGLRLYDTAVSGMPVRVIDATQMANGSEKAEYDIEAATVSDDGKTIYWIASLSNSKKGKKKEYRNRAFSTFVNGEGATATLSAGTYTEAMRDAMIAFGDANGWNFSASASYAERMIPKRIDGFNVEGLTLKKGGGTAYVAFRAPCVPEQGVAPNASNRQYAVMAPVTNFEQIFSGTGESHVMPQTSDPVLFDFGGLGFRAIERVDDYYIIVAGLSEGGGTPKVYLWDGTTHVNAEPIVPDGIHLTEMNLDMSELGGANGHPEEILATKKGNKLTVRIVSDCGVAKMGKFRLDTYLYKIPKSMRGKKR